MDAYLIYLIVLRTIHIVGGICWVGGAIMNHFFLEPTTRANGPEGQRFMQFLILRRRFPAFMSIASLSTIISGVLLYGPSSSGWDPEWITSGPGLVLTLGSVAGFVALVIGFAIISPAAVRLMGLGQTIATAGGPPLPEQVTQLHHLEARMSRAGSIEFILMMLSVVAMAVARYWWF